MDGGAQEWQGQEEVQASEQGSIHLKDVPERRFSHRGAEEPAHHREMTRNTSVQVQAISWTHTPAQLSLTLLKC